jgi:putative FmdB family regulatory protein
MPTYEYQCKRCGKAFEYFQKVSEEPKGVCENCGGELTRLISSGAGLIFKGSGFYATDYKKKGEGEKGKKKVGKEAEKTPEKAVGKKPEAGSGGKEPKAAG